MTDRKQPRLIPPPNDDPPRLAASVLLARQTPGGIEIFMVRRPANASAFADVFVFPGGTVRQDDFGPPLDVPGFFHGDALSELTIRGGTPPVDASRAVAIYHAALRELFEEAGVLLARDRDGHSLQISEADGPRFAQFRRALQAGQTTLFEILATEHLTLDYRQLRYFSHWITPLGLARRFDTRFFAAAMPAGQTALHCQIETTEGIWIRPRDALARADVDRFGIVFPTRKHLERLSGYASLDGFLDYAARKPIQTVQPIIDENGEADQKTFTPKIPECW